MSRDLASRPAIAGCCMGGGRKILAGGTWEAGNDTARRPIRSLRRICAVWRRGQAERGHHGPDSAAPDMMALMDALGLNQDGIVGHGRRRRADAAGACATGAGAHRRDCFFFRKLLYPRHRGRAGEPER